MNILKRVTLACIFSFFAATSFAIDSSSGAGTVAETMDSGGYTYIRLEENDRWVAGPPTAASIGDNVTYTNAVDMGEFHSRTLNRTFKNILFTPVLTVVKQVDADAHANSAMNTAVGDQLGIEKSAAITAPAAGEITPPDGGKTIAAIGTEFQQLDSQQVTVRAKVIKVSKNILGKNWITLMDGTGTEPENKLLATSAELVEIGDVVTATGVVKTDVDLGSGYKYKVVLEQATFSK